MPISTSTIRQFTVKPLPNAKPNGFGVSVEGCDINNLSEAQFKELEHIIYTHKVVVVKGQAGMLPPKQQELGIRFDPATPAELGHMEDVAGKKTIFGPARTERKPTLPGAWLVNLNGSGSYEAGHLGIDHPFNLKAMTHLGFHRDELTAEESAQGDVRFQRWHIDCPFWKNWAARVTTIWAHTMPSGADVTVRWDDGSNLTMKAPPGRTAFIDCVGMYESFTPEQKKWVDHSLIEYAASPYQWLAGAKAMSNGLAMFTEGKESTPEELADVDPAGQQTIPMLWINPVTGEKAFQVHGIIAYKIHYRESADAPYTIIDDLATVRKMIDDLQRPWLIPENVLFAPTDNGDLLCFYNRGVRHSAVEFPADRGNRLLHQLQLVASDPPFDPAPIEGLPYYKTAIAV